MQTMQQLTSRFLLISAVSLALSAGVAGAAHAQTTADGNAAAPHHAGKPHGRHGRHGGFLQDLKKLHDKLNLNADQEKQYQAALATAKQNHDAARVNFRQFRQQVDSLRQQPVLDLNALHDARQHLTQQNAQLRDQTEGAWLSFYNGLSDQQKATVSDALKAHFAKAGQRHKQHAKKDASAAQ